MSHTGTLERSGAWRSEIAATLTLAWPLAAANLLQMLVYAVDVIFVARLGELSLGATSLSIALFGTVAWALSGLTAMVSALIAAAIGRGTGIVREVRRATRMALWLAVMFGLAVTAMCQFAEPIMLAADQEPEIARLAGTFLPLLGWAAVPILISNVLRSYVAALGRPIFATVIIAGAVLVAVLGNYTFVFGHFGAPAMGIRGSALAGVITSSCTALAYVVAVQSDRRLARFHIFGRLWSPDWHYFRTLLILGAPVFGTVLAEAALFNGAAFMMGLIGPAELAGHTIALQIAAFAFQVPFGVGQAATIRVGYYYGAGDHEGIRRAGTSAMLIGGGFMTITASAMLFAPHTLLRLYIDPYAPANLAMAAFAVRFMTVAAGFQLFDGMQAVTGGALRGLQDTRVPMAIALIGYWVPGLGAMVWLGFYTPLAGTGIWLGLLVGLVAVAGSLFFRWTRRARFGLLPRRDTA
ncbi:MATE family efflux transporter [Tsuneonella mangrovi]|uniref:MATE family efflux transporter n=1 Tax=Tsuneonella mangrovi TaxID=1982042 RepID=UPI000BA1EF65|nr:MATE family efflux transporter [Tsuneonella mangrovi]